ncbi:hypothetical protein DL93DRAFT_2182876 [Clavulina sp. PMI_390]|nr:hypothetical protein DL93DRAFT_2182876 [Clavulina sp. PMI_390]
MTLIHTSLTYQEILLKIQSSAFGTTHMGTNKTKGNQTSLRESIPCSGDQYPSPGIKTKSPGNNYFFPNPRDILFTQDSTGKTLLKQLLDDGSSNWDQKFRNARLLIDHGASPEPGLLELATHYAIKHSDAAIINTFANQYGLEYDPGFALHVSVEEESIECVQTLLDLHIDLNICNKDGKGPLDCALEYHGQESWQSKDNDEYIRAVQNYKPSNKQRRIYELLEQHGAKLHHVSGDSNPGSEPGSAEQ